MAVPEIERKVRQLNNDVTSIYSMLDGITKTQREHGTVLEGHGQQLSSIAARQMRHDNRFSEIAATQDEHSTRLAEMAAVQQRQGNRLDEHGAKLDEHGAKLDEHGAKLDEHGAKLDEILELLRGRRSG